jgi:hypothetical protein
MTVGRMQIALGEHVASTVGRVTLVTQDCLLLDVGLRCPATDFEQVCGAAQAALRISRVVSDVVAYVLKALRCRRWALPYAG